MRLLSLVVILVLCSTAVVATYPNIDYRGVSKEMQSNINKFEYGINETYFNGIKKIIIYNRDMWANVDAYYYPTINFILIDGSGLLLADYNIKHELAHHQCWINQKNLSHGKCFNDEMNKLMGKKSHTGDWNKQ